jgi:hypothetical protein
VKDHYLGWLARARPDLVPRHERLFSRGAYQPKAERARLAEIAASVIEDRFGATGARPEDRHWRRQTHVDQCPEQGRTDDGDRNGERSGTIPVQLRFMR